MSAVGMVLKFTGFVYTKISDIIQAHKICMLMLQNYLFNIKNFHTCTSKPSAKTLLIKPVAAVLQNWNDFQF
jgi:hypothetical protein